ncbi:hypothetical protein TRICI_001648 [Trichomonascus ciferrii]|uniref:COP9 signalosome complex subunit 5 n=1 Tax=Trichomonascus ciferrii TaxID=44093 RepID=A0A642V8V5_9ASCO|nr:hypothetical protein TRICI_001648 [Trichomonascus ciferrii]
MSTSPAKVAKLNFELENEVEDVGGSNQADELYAPETDEQKELLKKRPWKDDPTYFKRVRISAIALLRMAIHARSGGSIEVMGVMTGKIRENEFVVMDVFALPVEGTETRVNAMGEAYEYMVQYANSLEEVGRTENIVGWYHSHPGYGCWLSGIDVGTQFQNQQFQDPFLALVVDPHRTISAGKVDIGAFRTYPEGYSPSRSDGDTHQNIPLAKMEDFGVHASKYYQLEISYFKSSLDTELLDLLWNKYWASTLSQSPLITNQNYTSEQMSDLAKKTAKLGQNVSHGKLDDYTTLRAFRHPHESEKTASKKTRDSEVETDAVRIGSEQVHGLLARELNDRLFAGI